MSKPKEYIDTIRGKAYFIKTITEDKNGNWDDHWSTIAGEFVIHEGKKHHVYKVGYKEYDPYHSNIKIHPEIKKMLKAEERKEKLIKQSKDMDEWATKEANKAKRWW